MAKLSEMGFGAKFLVVFFVTLLAGAAYYYVYYNNENQKNQQLATKIAEKKAENDRLREFEPKLKQLERDMAILEQQIEREKKVVPDDKDADQFIRLLHDTAASAGIKIRRYTSQPTANHEFYSEVPFAIDIDGPYYSVLNFFQRVSELERIVNIDNLQVSNSKNTGPSKVKSQYPYGPNETIVASCTASTFFSREPEAPQPAKPGQKPPAPTTAAAATPR
jgi:type IV pilus assembly protein PilO